LAFLPRKKALQNATHIREQTLDHVRRIMVEYHSRDLLRQVREILARKGFAQEMIVDYYAEDAAAEQDEVGILYARRASMIKRGSGRSGAKATRRRHR
jgi:predicted urease superfamily metal-dependent hydrolase